MVKRKLRALFSIPRLLTSRIRTPDDFRRVVKTNTKLVTLDVFDTAVLRPVAHPDDVVALSLYRAQKRLGLALSFPELLAARRSAEAAARQAAHAEGRDEITLHEIREHLKDLPPEIADKVIQEEFATEKSLCQADPVILAGYQFLCRSGVRVAFLSDTYLSSDAVAELLKGCGYSGDLEVYVSSEAGTSKAARALYKRLTAKTNLLASQISHIGDNAMSDVASAREVGVYGYWYRRKLYRQRRTRANDEPGLARSLATGYAVLQQTVSPGNDTWETIGASVAGPLYLGFVQWLVEELRRTGPHRVFFFARDGLIMQRVYDRLRVYDPKLPPSTYLLVSRRSVVVPGFESLGEAELDFLSSYQLPISVEQFLTRIQLDPLEHRKVLDRHGFSVSKIVDRAEKTRLRAVFLELEPEILRVAQGERQLLMSFLEQEKCFEGDRFAMVDIGWSGSLQRALTPLIYAGRPGAQINGFYLGTTRRVRSATDAGGTTSGWLSDADDPDFRARTLRSGLAIAELLFTADHGSVLTYKQIGKSIEATYAPLGITVHYARAAAQIQRAALRFVDHYIAAFDGFAPARLDRDDSFALLARLIERPSLQEATMLGNLVHVDGFGATTSGQPLACPPSLLNALRQPRTLIDGYLHAPWRLAYLVRILKLPLLAEVCMRLKRRFEQKGVAG